VGGAAIESVLEARKDGPFKDIFDFCERVDLRKVNKRVVEALIKCGAFDSTGAKRAPLMAGLEDVMLIAQKIQQERESAQHSLFGADEIVRTNGNGNGRHTLPDISEWDEKLLLNFEKEALGFYITGHPLQRHAATMKRFSTCTIAELTERADKNEVRISGIVATLKELLTKKGDRMGFATLEDLTGSVEVIAFPEVYAQNIELLKGEEPLLVTGTVDMGEKGAKLIATDVVLLSDYHERETSVVHLTLSTTGLDLVQLKSLKGVLDRHTGSCKVLMHFNAPTQFNATVCLPDNYTVAGNDDLAVDIKNLLGYAAVTFE
jgi:DNA polymerase-3 subunit alpha